MLNRIMTKDGVSTVQLHVLTGIPKRTLDHYRSGTREMSLVNGLKIADALHVEPWELILEPWDVIDEARS